MGATARPGTRPRGTVKRPNERVVRTRQDENRRTHLRNRILWEFQNWVSGRGLRHARLLSTLVSKYAFDIRQHLIHPVCIRPSDCAVHRLEVTRLRLNLAHAYTQLRCLRPGKVVPLDRGVDTFVQRCGAMLQVIAVCLSWTLGLERSPKDKQWQYYRRQQRISHSHFLFTATDCRSPD